MPRQAVLSLVMGTQTKTSENNDSPPQTWSPSLEQQTDNLSPNTHSHAPAALPSQPGTSLPHTLIDADTKSMELSEEHTHLSLLCGPLSLHVPSSSPSENLSLPSQCRLRLHLYTLTSISCPVSSLTRAHNFVSSLLLCAPTCSSLCKQILTTS